jgi:hypothetical protein
MGNDGEVWMEWCNNPDAGLLKHNPLTETFSVERIVAPVTFSSA